ncbi:MAG: glycosyltransferase family 39 protein [Candidatus Omnitrophica bacterium]|nr:glycosyltransferase family 39 protein [Candidatus Omnitrophota bacterium]
MVILIPICFLFLWADIFIRNRSKNEDSPLRVSFLYTSIFLGTAITFINETLSLFARLTFNNVAIFWLATIIFAIVWLIKQKQGWKHFKEIIIPELSPFEKFMLSSVIAIVALIGITAVVAPPNTSDAMVYHMSRVMHWIQNKSVKFYPTNILRQLHMNPGAEYIILHLQLLAGGDRFANMVQWFAMTASLIGVSLIAKKLGADRKTQITSVVIAATIPMGILQGSSTQNDYVTTYWTVSFVYFVLSALSPANPARSIPLGLSLGLAILTKATAYIYNAPFALWLLVTALARKRSEFLKLITVICSLILILNSGHYIRNFHFYNNPIGPIEESPASKYTNDILTPASVLSNSLKNISLHLGTPSRAVNRHIEDALRKINATTGLDINDPKTTWPNYKINKMTNHEDKAGNPVHLLLILAAIIFIPLSKKTKDKTQAMLYCSSIVLSFLLFSAILKWQPFHSRLHLPFFVLFAPAIAMIIPGIRYKILTPVLLTLSIPWVLYNSSSPLIGKQNIFSKDRASQYFVTRTELELPYRAAGRYFATESVGIKTVTLKTGINSWEYPLWIILEKMKIDTGEINYPWVSVDDSARELNIQVDPDKKITFKFGPERKMLDR